MHVAMHGVIRPHQDSSRPSAGQPANANSFASLIDNLPGGGDSGITPPVGGGGSNTRTLPVGKVGGGNPNITPPVGTLPPPDLSNIGIIPGAFAGDASMLADMVPAEGGAIADPSAQSRSSLTGPPSTSFDVAEEITATAGTAAVSALQALLLLSEI